MAVQDETDVFNMEPVASVTTEITDTIEGKDLRKYVFQIIRPEITNPSYSVTEHDIGVLISHHCGRRRLKKAALLTLPYIINANLVTASWKKKKKDTTKGNKQKDTRPSGMISAPILINGIKYLCNLTVKKNTNKTVTPYALALKDANGKLVETEKMVSIQSSVPDSSSEPTTIGDVHSVKATTSHDTNPSFQSANVQQNTETNNNNDIKTENIRMNKKLIRLTENDLHKIVKESINKTLNEMDENNTSSSLVTQNSLDKSIDILSDTLELLYQAHSKSKFCPTVAAILRQSGVVDDEAVSKNVKIHQLIHQLEYMDISRIKTSNGETFTQMSNRKFHSKI